MTGREALESLANSFTVMAESNMNPDQNVVFMVCAKEARRKMEEITEG